MTRKTKKYIEVKLDAEEQELLDSIERDEWKSACKEIMKIHV